MTFRETDEMHLEWLTRWNNGESLQSIAAASGVSKGTVIGQVQRIRGAIEASGVA